MGERMKKDKSQKDKDKSFLYFRSPVNFCLRYLGMCSLPGWQGRALMKHPAGVSSEQPDCRGGQFRHPGRSNEFFVVS